MNYDCRTPGLFKVEAEGNGMVALCSKTYLLTGDAVEEKLSCTGVNTVGNASDMFIQVFKDRQPVMATNRGFRLDNQVIKTYSQVKTAVNYSYWKRIVRADRISTSPLSLSHHGQRKKMKRYNVRK